MARIMHAKPPAIVAIVVAISLLALIACAVPPASPTAVPIKPAAAVPAVEKPAPAAATADMKPDPALLAKMFPANYNFDPLVTEAMAHASVQPSDADKQLALKCWKNQGCETGRGTLTVAYAQGSPINYWTNMVMMEFVLQALSYPDVKKIVITVASSDPQKEISDLRSLAAQKVDVIVAGVTQGEADLPPIREATQAGVAVVPILSEIGGTPGKDYASEALFDWAGVGRDQAQVVVKELNGSGSVAIFGGPPGYKPMVDVTKAAEEVLAKAPGITYLGEQDTMITEESAFKVASSFLSRFPKIDAIIHPGSADMRGAVRAYQTVNRPIDGLWMLLTDSQGIISDWEKANNPKWKMYMTPQMTHVARIALTLGLAAKAGKPVPTKWVAPINIFPITKGIYDPSQPDDYGATINIPKDVIQAMFK